MFRSINIECFIRLYYLIQVFNCDRNEHNISLMAKLSFHLFCCFLMLFHIAAGCETVVYTMECSFNVASNSSDCSTFQYISCTYLSCPEPDINGSCTAESRQVHQDWSTCLSSCCGIDNGPQRYSTLSHCHNSKQQASLIFGISIGGVFFILTITILICCCLRKRISICCKNMRNQLRGVEEPQNANPIASSSQLKAGLQVRQAEQILSAWVVCSAEQYNQINETICVICLEERPTIKLLCGHMYHRNCIKCWVDRRRACPLCQSCHFERTTIICEKCNFKRRDRTFSIDKLCNNSPHCCIECRQSI